MIIWNDQFKAKFGFPNIKSNFIVSFIVNVSYHNKNPDLSASQKIKIKDVKKKKNWQYYQKYFHQFLNISKFKTIIKNILMI